MAAVHGWERTTLLRSTFEAVAQPHLLDGFGINDVAHDKTDGAKPSLRVCIGAESTIFRYSQQLRLGYMIRVKGEAGADVAAILQLRFCN